MVAGIRTPEPIARMAERLPEAYEQLVFMVEDRLPIVRRMILARDKEERCAALDELLPLQQADFEGIFGDGWLPGHDPPARPAAAPVPAATRGGRRRAHARADQAAPGVEPDARHARLALQYPEIYEMQVRAIVRAARAVGERTGNPPLVEIMHPLVGFAEELKRLNELTKRVAAEEPEVEYLCGTMIELPRAALRADELAEHADFFSFGTNDLTQTALGFSRDDAEGKFLTYYLDHGILERNPFETLDQSGVSALMRIGVERGRAVKDLKLGICGEHGGEPKSVAFCHALGLDYVSCSPTASRSPASRLRRPRSPRPAWWPLPSAANSNEVK